jgi:hypothetical protein
MAREVGLLDGRDDWSSVPEEYMTCIKDFEALVRADERNRTWTQEHWTEYEQAIVQAEREACAKVCDMYAKNSSHPMNFAENCAEVIREIGETK